MLTYTLRRILMAIPSLLFISLVSFLLLVPFAGRWRRVAGEGNRLGRLRAFGRQAEGVVLSYLQSHGQIVHAQRSSRCRNRQPGLHPLALLRAGRFLFLARQRRVLFLHHRGPY